MPAVRVLYVVSLFPCWSETFIVREMTALIAGGADVKILSLKAPYEKLVQADAERLMPRARHPLPPARAALARLRAFAAHPVTLAKVTARIVARMARTPRDLAKTLEALARGVEQLDWIREFDPHVIHAHFGTFPSTVAWALAKILDKPFGMTCHAHDIFENNHLLEEKIAAVQAGVTISRFNVEYLAEHVTPLARERMSIVHCGVNLPEIAFEPGGREPGTILAVGRMVPIKGFEVLIDAVAELKQQGRRVRCTIIGEGPLEAPMRAQIARLGLGEEIVMPGVKPSGEVREALHRSAIFCLPSVVTETGDRDGIPVSLMESMAAGTPVVSTLVSGIPELVADGEEGLLVPEKDPRALAAALGRLLDDPALAARMAQAARAKVEREFDAVREAEKMRALFARAAGE